MPTQVVMTADDDGTQRWETWHLPSGRCLTPGVEITTRQGWRYRFVAAVAEGRHVALEVVDADGATHRVMPDIITTVHRARTIHTEEPGQ